MNLGFPVRTLQVILISSFSITTFTGCSSPFLKSEHFPNEVQSYLHLLKRKVSSQDSSMAKLRRSEYEGISSILIRQNNQIIFEEYFGLHSADKRNDLRSAGKSIFSAVYGIAFDQSLFKSVGESIYDYLPYESYLNWNEDKHKITFHHLLSMTAGWECDSIYNYKTHCGYTMYEYDDPYKWLLDRPMESAPGVKYNYNDGIPDLLWAILTFKLGHDLKPLAKKHLFEPIGIKSDFFSGDGLTTREMSLFGQLFLNKGSWGGIQLISEEWVKLSTSAKFEFKQNKFADSYGYFWWIKTFQYQKQKIETYFAAGNGGQYIIVIPKFNAVVVFTGTNYNRFGKMKTPFSLFEEYILPSLQTLNPNESD